MIDTPKANEAAVRRHTTRARNELENIISMAQQLHKRLERGQAAQGDAQSLITASVTVAERFAMLETLRDSDECWKAELVAEDWGPRPTAS